MARSRRWRSSARTFGDVVCASHCWGLLPHARSRIVATCQPATLCAYARAWSPSASTFPPHAGGCSRAAGGGATAGIAWGGRAHAGSQACASRFAAKGVGSGKQFCGNPTLNCVNLHQRSSPAQSLRKMSTRTRPRRLWTSWSKA